MGLETWNGVGMKHEGKPQQRWQPAEHAGWQDHEETSRGDSGVLAAVPTAMDRHELGTFARSAAGYSFLLLFSLFP